EGDPVSEEMEGDPVSEEMEGDPVSEEMEGDPVSEEMEGDSVSEEVEGDSVSEEVEGDPVSKKVEGDPVSKEFVGDEPLCPPRCEKSVCDSDCKKRARLKPLIKWGPVDDYQASVPQRPTVGRAGRPGHPDLLSALGFHSRSVAGGSPAGRVPVHGMPRGAVGLRPSGVSYPSYGGMLLEGQEYPTSVPQGLSWLPMYGEMLLDGETPLNGAVVVPNEPPPAAVPPLINSSSSTAPREVQHASLESSLLELNTPDKAISNRPKPSSKFEPITR
ncbi:MAG: hypothetical protein NTY19_24955, partial [Planctomycetota bacterium]|nr:hypothetical protein [Planctomycetota bacterium]